MVINCAVKGCRSSHSKLSGISFHRIPKDPVMRHKWYYNLNILKDTQSGVVCSKHFKQSDYKAHTEKKLLKNNVIPIPLKGVKLPPPNIVPFFGVADKTVDAATVAPASKCNHPRCRCGDRILLPKPPPPQPVPIELNASNKENTFILPKQPLPKIVNVFSMAQEELAAAAIVDSEHNYVLPPAGAIYERNAYIIDKLESSIKRRRLHAAQVLRLKKTIAKKNRLIDDLTNNATKSDKNECKLCKTHNFNKVLYELLKIHCKGTQPKQYSDAVKDFAVELSECSQEAYELVHKVITLPSLRTLRNWKSCNKVARAEDDDTAIFLAEDDIQVAEEVLLCEQEQVKDVYDEILDYPIIILGNNS